MKKKLLLGIVISASAAGLWSLMTGRDAVKNDQVKTETAEGSKLGFIKDSKPAKNTVVEEPSVIPSTEQITTNEATKTSAVLPVPYEAELNEYAIIKNKVFLTDEEKAARRAMLNNDGMLRSLGDYLMDPASVNPESDQARNLATDLLLEALKTDNSAVAQAALQELIQDAKIEDPKIEQNTRLALAGTKAEVLYHWSSMDPQKSSQMVRWLPGPVSQKIWQNVISAQNQNRMESATIKSPSS